MYHDSKWAVSGNVTPTLTLLNERINDTNSNIYSSSTYKARNNKITKSITQCFSKI